MSEDIKDLHTQRITKAEPTALGVRFNPLYLHIESFLGDHHKNSVQKIDRILGFDGRWSFYMTGCYKHLHGFSAAGHWFGLEQFKTIKDATHISPSDCLPLVIQLDDEDIAKKYGIA